MTRKSINFVCSDNGPLAATARHWMQQHFSDVYDVNTHANALDIAVVFDQASFEHLQPHARHVLDWSLLKQMNDDALAIHEVKLRVQQLGLVGAMAQLADETLPLAETA